MIVNDGQYLIVNGPVPGFRVHLIIFGFQTTVTLKGTCTMTGFDTITVTYLNKVEGCIDLINCRK